MSTENELNKALSGIYSDLEKLQNAREQVEIVTKSSDDLAKSTSTLSPFFFSQDATVPSSIVSLRRGILITSAIILFWFMC